MLRVGMEVEEMGEDDDWMVGGPITPGYRGPRRPRARHVYRERRRGSIFTS